MPGERREPDAPVRIIANDDVVKARMAHINKDKKQKFGVNGQHLTAKEYLKQLETSQWIRKKQLASKENFNSQEEKNRKNIEFAKNLFISWDDDGSGVLEANEIIKPLVQLGLAPDSQFAWKILSSLDPRGGKAKELTDLKITLKDFIKIFKSSKVSENLLNIIHKESLKHNQEQQPGGISEMPYRRHDHPTVGHTEPEIMRVKEKTIGLRTGSAVERNAHTFSLLKREPRQGNRQSAFQRAISISMLSKEDNVLVEIPIDSNPPKATKPLQPGRKKEFPKVSEQ